MSEVAIFTPLPLTETGRPQLWPSEVEVYSQSHVTLYDNNVKTDYIHGRCVITTHRLLWMSEELGINIFMPLSVVERLGKEAGFITRSSKIRIDYTHENVHKFVKLSFKVGGRDEFFAPLETALCRRAWADTKSVSALADRRLQARQFDPTQAGIGGIIQRRQEEQKQTTELATQSFTDLNALMDKAKDMVGLIERYVATVHGNTQAEDETNQMNSLLLNMGISSPVTRENAGDAYHQQLARQLAEFLKIPMQNHGGIMTLSDIYCLFNRARGTELISPDDLYHAAMLQKTLHLGLHVRKFEGGLIVLQADFHNEEQVASRLEILARQSKEGCITSNDVAQELHISLSLAQEYLKVAEQKGKLCRDDTFEGLNFYPNRFPEFLV